MGKGEQLARYSLTSLVSVSHLNKWVNLVDLHKEKHKSTYTEFLGQLNLVDNMLYGKLSVLQNRTSTSQLY